MTFKNNNKVKKGVDNLCKKEEGTEMNWWGIQGRTFIMEFLVKGLGSERATPLRDGGP